MTGLLQNLVRLGRGEPIPGAARASLPPRFAAPVRNDDAPTLETRPAEAQAPASLPTAMPGASDAADFIMDTQAPQRGRQEPDNGEAPLRLADKATAAAQAFRPIDAPTRSPADTAARVLSHDPPPGPQLHDAVLRDAPRPRNESATQPVTPLGQAVLAGQAQRRRETPPVIKVTIDRIDIRSPEAARTTRAVKPAPKPSVSLSDYLRRPGPGGRA